MSGHTVHETTRIKKVMWMKCSRLKLVKFGNKWKTEFNIRRMRGRDNGEMDVSLDARKGRGCQFLTTDLKNRIGSSNSLFWMSRF